MDLETRGHSNKEINVKNFTSIHVKNSPSSGQICSLVYFSLKRFINDSCIWQGLYISLSCGVYGLSKWAHLLFHTQKQLSLNVLDYNSACLHSLLCFRS
ncbi:hypothetical protein FQN60_007545 [Etheostoma spectabile]|uniref:Uncharacterized protein n=1 Tax=Etheostoma spectabile TaxID=54343 RepID=A0A5J5CZ91_9PERO|nr:hypothetical protein FQN60_007545 [Etheostoma spectabile]